jgi:hypothetical protein
MKFFALLFTYWLMMTGCTFKARNILMVPRLIEPDVIKLYFDREGYLYPPEAHVTPYYFYLMHQPRHNRKQTNPEYASIQYAIRKNDSLTLAYMRQRYQLPGPDTSLLFFLHLQQSLRSTYIERINNSLKQQKNPNLVVLIHGFNDPYPDAYYFSLRRAIMARQQQPFTFVEVYWDGLTALGTNPAVAGIWQNARLNSAKVGLGLRNVMKNLDTTTTLTVLTHSLGASVAAHMLFNPVNWPAKFQEQRESDYKSDSISTPQVKEIRLGMIAPAIAGEDIFHDVLQTVPQKNSTTLKRVVIGYNHYDYAVTKGRLFPRLFGNTSLGADADDEVKKTIKIIQQQDTSIQCNGVDFSYKMLENDTAHLTKKEKRHLQQQEHAILFYQQNIRFNQFMQLLFD